MFKLDMNALKAESNVFSLFHRKVLNFLILISFLIIIFLVVINLTGLVELPEDMLSFAMPLRVAGLTGAFFFNYRRRISIAKHIFIIVELILTIRLLLFDASIDTLPIVLMLFVLYPVYISFFMNPKAGLMFGFGCVLFILGYFFYLLIWKSFLFEEWFAFSFAHVFLSPMVMIVFITIVFYYFTSKNKQYIEVIQESSNHIVSILNAVTDVLLVVDPRGNIKTINKAGLDILEYSGDDLIGKPLHILFKNKEDGIEVLDRINHDISFSNYKSFLKTKNGNEIIAGINSSIIFTKDKKRMSEIIITARDLTRLFRYTKRLKKINKKARTYQVAMLNMLEDLNEKNRILLETEHQVKEYSRLLEENIEQAKEHQTKLISVKTPLLHDICFSSAYIPCEKVGGDIINIIVFYDVIFFYIADIVGHGVPAAILSSFIKASLDNWIKEEHHISPGFLLKKLNDVLVDEEIFKEKFFTIFIGKILRKPMELQYISAGHLSPIILNMENNEISELTTRSRPVISMFELENQYHNTLKLPKKLRFLVYTDGLIEWEVQEGEFFGKSKLFRFFQKEELSKKNISVMVEQAVANQLDDISFILIEFNDIFERKLYCRAEVLDACICEFEDEMSDRYPSDTIHGITRCFSELVTNAVVHGNKNNEDYETYIKVQFYKETVHLFVKDSGEGFNWRDLDLSVPEGENKPRGLVFVFSQAQSVKFNERGNEVECMFTIKSS